LPTAFVVAITASLAVNHTPVFGANKIESFHCLQWQAVDCNASFSAYSSVIRTRRAGLERMRAVGTHVTRYDETCATFHSL